MKILTHKQQLQKIFSVIAQEKTPLIVLTVLFCILTIVTYAKWMTILGFDVNREFLVPYLITKGFFIYSDFHYNYGPLIPYLLAILLKMFGFKLIVFYVSGIILAFCYTFVLYRLTRLFLPPFYTTITCILFLTQCVFFNNAIFSFIVPYSYATVICGLLVIIMLIYLIKHFDTSDDKQLLVPFVCCSICLLSKQDYFIITFGSIVFYYCFFNLIKTPYIKDCSFLEKVKNYLKNINYKLIPQFGLITAIPSIIVYGLISLKTGIPVLFNCLFPFENLRHPVVKYFIGVTCKGCLLLPNLTHMLFYAVFSALILAVLFYIIYLCIKLNKNKGIVKTLLIILLGLLILLLILIKADKLNPAIELILQLKYIYSGINVWILLVLLFSLYKIKETTYQKLIILIVVALISNFRTFYGMDLAGYSFYYLPLSLVIFVFLIKTFFPYIFWRILNIDLQIGAKASKILLILLCIVYFLLILGIYKDQTYKITSKIGTFYHQTDQKENIDILLEIINSITTQTQPEDKIIAYPARLELYTLSQRLPASKYYYLTPGTTNSIEEEFQIIDELKKNNPKVIITSNNDYNKRTEKHKLEYETHIKKYNINTIDTELTFGADNYYPYIYEWIKTNYKLQKKYFIKKFNPPLTIELYTH